MRPSGWPRLLVLVALTLLRALPAAATTAADVCSGNPCVLSGSRDVTRGSTLDFGDRDFRMAQNGRLILGDGDTLVILARNVTLQQGALIRGPLTPSVGVTVRIQTRQDIQIQRSGLTRARIEAHGQAAGGTIRVLAQRNVDLAGDLRVDGTAAEADGGLVDIEAGGAVTMTGDVNATGGLAAIGGTVTVDTVAGGAIVTAGGPVVVASMDVSGGDGGAIEVSSGASLTTTGLMNAAGKVAGSGGGSVTLDATGTLTVGGRITAPAEGSLVDGGTGGDVDISATGNIQLNERIEVFAGGPDGGDGFITVTAGANLTQAQPIFAHGTGPETDAGEVELTAVGVLTMNALIDVHGRSAGTVSGQGGAEVRARGEINAEGADGTIELTTLSITGTPIPGPVTVGGNLHARGPTGGDSGSITLQGCDVTVEASGRVVTGGANASNVFRSSRQMTIAGQVIAGPPGSNRFEFRNPPGLQPVIGPGAVVNPSPVVVESALLACVPATPPVCGNGMTEAGESCDDGDRENCDGCDEFCAVEACGDGKPRCTEGCDDGNVLDGDGCDANCTVTACGNGRITACAECPGGQEQCDDGNTNAGDGCSEVCQIETPQGCGNGMTEEGEECDDGGTADCDGCSRLCLSEGCGNNRVECAEVCDEGNALDCDGDRCAANCLGEEVCGDGIVQCFPQEQCDAGPDNSKPGVGCNMLCRLCDLGTGDCPCGADTDCHPLGKCGGRACDLELGFCVAVTLPSCNDNDVCTGTETCADGVCFDGTPLQCADTDPCTVDSCDPRAGCRHALATGLSSVSCRVEAFRLALDATPDDQVRESLRTKLDKAAVKLQAAVDAAANAGNATKRLRRLLKKVERTAKKVLQIVEKGARKNQLPATLAETLRTAANGARTAAGGLRQDL